MMTNPIGRLSANNAAYNWMNAANARINLLSFGGNNTAALFAADKNLQQQMLMDSFNYKCYSALADMQERIQKENIKRSFSIFA